MKNKKNKIESKNLKSLDETLARIAQDNRIYNQSTRQDLNGAIISFQKPIHINDVMELEQAVRAYVSETVNIYRKDKSDPRQVWYKTAADLYLSIQRFIDCDIDWNSRDAKQKWCLGIAFRASIGPKHPKYAVIQKAIEDVSKVGLKYQSKKAKHEE